MAYKTRAELENERRRLRGALESIMDRVTGALDIDEDEDDEDYEEGEEDEEDDD